MKKTIRIMMEFLHSPLWYCGEKGVLLSEPTGFEIFVNDDELNETYEEISGTFSGYYEFNSHGQACRFNEVRTLFFEGNRCLRAFSESILE